MVEDKIASIHSVLDVLGNKNVYKRAFLITAEIQ